jgi:predicted transcriptional regulator
MVGERLAGASVTKTATLLGVSRATVSNAVSVAHTNRGKTSLKRNSGGKPTMTERNRHTLRRILILIKECVQYV